VGQVEEIKSFVLVLTVNTLGDLKHITFGCHGIPERCFHFKGSPMPFCARCLGASIGHVIVSIYSILVDIPSFLIFPIGCGILLADWIAQNYFRLYFSNYSRLITGIIGGIAVGIPLWHLLFKVFIFIEDAI